MADANTIALGVLITLVFAWRFARTRQLYLTSLKVRTLGLQPIAFKPRDLRSFVQQALLGRRSIEPVSFLIRGMVLAVVALCLLPFKDYEPPLWWLVIVMIVLYVFWCFFHGVMLKRPSRARALRSVRITGYDPPNLGVEPTPHHERLRSRLGLRRRKRLGVAARRWIGETSTPSGILWTCFSPNRARAGPQALDQQCVNTRGARPDKPTGQSPGQADRAG